MTNREKSEQATEKMYERIAWKEEMERFREIDYTDEQREYAREKLKIKREG